MYCYNIWKAPNAHKHIPFNSYRQARKTLKQLFKVANVNYVVFTGGEPFLAERFKELVLYVRMKKKRVNIITNGNAGTIEDYRQLHALGIDFFELPVHSAQSDIHDRMTQVQGAHKKSIKSIKQLLETGAQVVVVIVICKLNYRQIYETLEFLHSIGITRIMLNRFNIGGQGIRDAEHLQLSEQQLNTAFFQASKAGADFKLKLSSNVCTPLCIVKPEDFPNIYFTSCPPEVSKRPITLDLFGNLRFCNHSPEVLGNIFIDTIEEMLTGEKAQTWSTVTPDYCIGCELYAKCMAGCRAASQQLGFGNNMADPVVFANGIGKEQSKKT